MLNEDTNASIRADEKITFDVRTQLQEHSRDGIWKLVNEPFSLWLLSTLLVGALTFA